MTTPSRSRSVILCSIVFLASTAVAQIPTQCLEIESILVDACIDQAQCLGASEGQNEMVRFRTGPAPIALGDIAVNWPNNPWLGLVQDATTASLTAALNSSIQGCGRLIEPVGGIIPPGSAVLMVTSTAMCAVANSFANLGDTLYIVYQTPGNSMGHFLNQNNGPTVVPAPTGVQAFRTLVITHVPTNCSDTVTYDANQLVNILGTYGGNAAQNDGATVQATWPGVPQVSYVNYGCQAPFEPILVSIDMVTGELCAGGAVDLTGSASGNFDVLLWQGGTGVFSDPNSLVTTYTSGPGDMGDVLLQLCAVGSCGASICADVTLPAGTAPVLTITPDGPTALCPGESVTLTVSGAASYVWDDLQSTASITVSQPGIYGVTGTNACGQATAQIEITLATGPAVTIDTGGITSLCPGVPLTLTAEGADTYVWSTTDVGPAILIFQAGTYSVTGTNSCGTTTVSITITEASLPLVVITPDGTGTICSGQALTLTATGADTYVWSTLETGSSIVITQPGTYGVTGSNACGNGTAEIDIIEGSFPTIVITPDGPTALCPGEDVVLTASGADSYEWDNSETTPSITVDQPGTYTVTGTNGCGPTTAQITITLGAAPTVVIVTDGPTEICPGQSVTLTASGADSYLWDNLETTPSITVDQPGTYTVLGTNGCGSTSGQITISAGTGPTIVIIPDGPTDLCSGQSVTLTASGADSYVWSNMETTPSITVDQPGTYTVVGTDACGPGTAQIEVTLAAGPLVTILPSGPIMLCPGETVQLTVSGADIYIWSTQERGPNITVSQAGTYSVQGVNACGEGDAQVVVSVVDIQASFTTSVTSGTAPLSVVFTNTSSPAGVPVGWDFDDGTVSALDQPTHVFEEDGLYTVSLSLSTQGCVSTATALISVGQAFTGVSEVRVPNVFSPNNDGVNDQLVLWAEGIRSLQMEIINRWGQMVAELKWPGQRWDARSLAGEVVPDGTYFYALKAVGMDGKDHDLKGTITILR